MVTERKSPSVVALEWATPVDDVVMLASCSMRQGFDAMSAFPAYGMHLVERQSRQLQRPDGTTRCSQSSYTTRRSGTWSASASCSTI
jgi:hypothetical protein